MRWILLALILVALPVRADQFEDATWAYEAGDYATAVKLWRPLAEGGDVRAQLVLAIMHQDGNGVPLELVRAHMWFNIAGANGAGRDVPARPGRGS